MTFCEISQFYSIPNLRKKEVISSDNHNIGRIIDVVFDKDFNLDSFILGGPRWEEVREALGFIEDIDPVIPANTVQEITKKVINLNVPRDSLKHKLEEGAFPQDVIFYSELKRKKILDSKNKKFGRIVNSLLLPSGEIAFIIGGNIFEELTEKIGLKTNVDLLLPVGYIVKVTNNEVHLNLPITELKVTVDDKPLDPDNQREYLNSIQNKKQMKLRLLEKRKPEEFREFSKFY